MNCTVCGIEFEGRADAKYCSPRCRKEASRNKSIVTDNVTLSDIPVTLNFEFYTETVERKTDMGTVPGGKGPIRTAKYWYDVPIAAIPVIKKDWPKMPGFMNGRQYFLWWKNEFKMNGDNPEIHNPTRVT